ncbi:hypothetical protein BX600DRAFT_466537 [Xylariales sp. PMI_506]|nr:hypothetical protein BX600DRAFT_466537 [Xylariales sp. PMI_506]
MPTLTFVDLNIVIPSLITCVEIVPLSEVFLHPYSWTPYVLSNSAGDYRGSDVVITVSLWTFPRGSQYGNPGKPSIQSYPASR